MAGGMRKDIPGDVHAALRGTMQKLCKWSKENFGSVAREIEKSQDTIGGTHVHEC